LKESSERGVGLKRWEPGQWGLTRELHRRRQHRPGRRRNVYYGIFSRKTARLLRSYDSEDEAIAAVRSALRAEPEAEGFLALMQFDEDGGAVQEWSGIQLRQLLNESVVGEKTRRRLDTRQSRV